LAQTMEVLTDLEALTDTELGAVIARSNELLQQRDSERKKNALSEAKRLLKAAGISAKIGKKKERK
jgi:hypothetical protein